VGQVAENPVGAVFDVGFHQATLPPFVTASNIVGWFREQAPICSPCRGLRRGWGPGRNLAPGPSVCRWDEVVGDESGCEAVRLPLRPLVSGGGGFAVDADHGPPVVASGVDGVAVPVERSGGGEASDYGVVVQVRLRLGGDEQLCLCHVSSLPCWWRSGRRCSRGRRYRRSPGRHGEVWRSGRR
jgi:hypothetical protein